MPVAPTISRLRILIVEDNPHDRRVLLQSLSCVTEEYHWAVAASLSEVQRMGERRWDVVLLDLFIPGSRGLDTLRRVQRFCPQTPIIVLLGENGEDLGLEAIKAGAQDYLLKSENSSRTLQRSIRHARERFTLIRQHKEEIHRLNRILAQSREGIVAVDREGIIEFANRPAARLLGTAIEDLVGTPWPHPVKTEGEGTVIEVKASGHAPRQVHVSVSSPPDRTEITHFYILHEVLAEIAEREQNETPAEAPAPAPAATAIAETASPPPPSRKTARKRRPKLRVLFVEDEALLRLAMYTHLEDCGLEVTVAEDGQAALDLIETAEAPFDVVVTDQLMPRLKGTALLALAAPLLPDASFILTSAHDLKKIAREAPIHDHVRFLPKPYRGDDLNQLIREMRESHADS